MNQLQKNVIRIKKPELLELTECADIFLAHFEPYNIFCTEEVEKIKACKYKTQKAAVFYDIIVTKTGSYGTLLKALKETNQSGVLNVLNSTNISVFDNLDLQYSKKLGTQEQCRTFTGVFGHRNVCVKKEDVEDNDGLKCKTDTLYQLKLLSSIENHSNLLMYYTTKFSSSNSPHLQIVFELCDTNLSDWIKVPKPEADLPVLVLNVLRQLTVGVKYLHDHNIVHSNLRPSHILLKQNSVLKRETVKIANFKLARELESSCKTYEASCEKILKHSDYYPQEILQHGGKGSVNIVSFILRKSYLKNPVENVIGLAS